ncbi:hypothetical protein ACFLZY_02675 [Patescibacteria group bacterium]
MSKTPNYDQKVKTILESTTPGERTCELTGEKWEMTEEEIGWYKKFNVPPSGVSPLNRMKYLTEKWPSGQYWYNKHPETGKMIVSGVHPATGIKVLPDVEWFDRDFSAIKKDVDFEVSIIDQLYDLRQKVPSNASRDYEKSENSISLASFGDINSYFVVGCKSKNTFHSIVGWDTEDSAEIYNCNAIRKSFQIVHSDKMYQCNFAKECNSCLNSSFLFDCRNCENCFGATNKRNKKYLWFNEQLSSEEWERRRAEVDLGSRKVVEEYLEKFSQLVKDAVWPENFNEKTEGCIGEYLTNCNDCRYVYFANQSARNIFWGAFAMQGPQDCAFCAEASGSQEIYYCSAATNSFLCKFSLWVSRCKELEYSIDCYDCEYCFGCVGLRKKQFCIFNKQYSEEDYWKKVDEIKCVMLDRDEYGKFLPPKFSPTHYVDCGATKYQLADLEFGKAIGANLFDPNSEGAIGDELAQAQVVHQVTEVPDHVKGMGDWAGKVLFDPVYKRRFSYLSPEIKLYQQLNIAPPREHTTFRTQKMVTSSNSGVFEPAQCDQCKKKLIISLNKTYPNRTIYCKPCYLKYLEEHG